MKTGLKVNQIQPFLQAALSVLECMGQLNLEAGEAKNVGASLTFENEIFLLQIGITGELKGQVLITMGLEAAKSTASAMMCGIEVLEMNEFSESALRELGNMAMGNAATLFSSQGVLIDITPPVSMMGQNLAMQLDVSALRVPLLEEGSELMGLYICVEECL